LEATLKKLLSLGILCASVIATPLAAHADAITGNVSVAFNVTGVTTSNTGGALSPVNNITSISLGNGIVTGAGSGDFSGIGVFSPLTASSTFLPNSSDGGSTTPFTFTLGNYGTFTETSQQLVSQNSGASSSFNIYLLGNFVPGSALPADTVDTASIVLGFTDNNGTYSVSGVLSTPSSPAPPPPPTVTPEPSSLALLGTGLMTGVGFLRRRYKA
jgi:hypothetical protein